MRAYKHGHGSGKRWHKILFFAGLAFLLLTVAGAVGVRSLYTRNLQPININAKEDVIFVVVSGASVDEIAEELRDKQLIRSTWAFSRYIKSNELADLLKAGTYRLQQSQDVPAIATILTEGRVAVDLFTILPARRLDQLRQAFIDAGYSVEQVDAALKPENYADHPALVDKPKEANLEGYLYPDSFHKIAETTPETLIAASLDEMAEALTPEIRAGIAKQGLSIHQGIIIASIVEQEIPSPPKAPKEDRQKAAQVFLTRIKSNMQLGSDVTAFYGAYLANKKPAVSFDSPYNTRIYNGLPPGPISNVSRNSLEAVAFPAITDFLYFVAGDDGITYFSKTIEEHEALTAQHCIELCR
ncbi:endolytic transglycosylase MltG [Candidatus Saccharibacteria bacterium]|nr:endolytic transglycosylase MltG [Candidatus Saccharibacteria bacterium]